MSEKIDIAEQLAAIVSGEIGNIKKQATKICRNHAKNLAETLKQTSPKDTGNYAEGWTSRKTYENPDSIEFTVGNKSRHAPLSYVLEKGRIDSKGERVGAKPHIAENAEKEFKEFYKDMQEIGLHKEE